MLSSYPISEEKSRVDTTINLKTKEPLKGIACSMDLGMYLQIILILFSGP